MRLTQSEMLGPYEILGGIGAGGMGEVYKARDTRLNRIVALKVLSTAVAGSDLTRRFEREAQAVAALNHPNICVVHDVGQDAGVPYFVMEHLEGETLAARLSRGALPLQQTLQYAVAIADALDKAHRAGVVHRDRLLHDRWTPEGGRAGGRTGSGTLRGGLAIGRNVESRRCHPLLDRSDERIHEPDDPDIGSSSRCSGQDGSEAC